MFHSFIHSFYIRRFLIHRCEHVENSHGSFYKVLVWTSGLDVNKRLEGVKFSIPLHIKIGLSLDHPIKKPCLVVTFKDGYLGQASTPTT